jgi:hypothetical protein
MSNHNHWFHLAHAATHDKSKGGAFVLIIVGFFMAPMLIGIPLLIMGVYRLFK